MKRLCFLSLALLLLVSQSALTQGSEVIFGKNKIQYTDDLFDWWMYETNSSVIYWYGKSKNPAIFCIRQIENYKNNAQQLFEYHLKDKIEIFVYADKSDFLQSNFDLYSAIPSQQQDANIPLVRNQQIVLYFNGDYNALKNSLQKAVMQVYFNSMFSGTGFREVVQKYSSFKLPDWFVPGLIELYADNWNASDENRIQQILRRKKNKIPSDPYDLAFYGKAWWNYIFRHYGQKSISSFLYLTRIHRDLNKAAKLNFGKSIKDLQNLAYIDYKSKYQETNDFLNPDYIVRLKRGEQIIQSIFNEADNSVILSTCQQSKVRIKYWNPETKKTKTLWRHGVRSSIEPNDAHFPIQLLSFQNKNPGLVIYESKNKICLSNYLDPHFKKHFFPEEIHEVYSGLRLDDDRLLLSVGIQSSVDLIVYSIRKRQYKRISQDLFQEKVVAWINRNEVLVLSDRIEDKYYLRFDTSLFNSELHAFKLSLKDFSLHPYPLPIEKGLQQGNYDGTSTYLTFENKNKYYILRSNSEGIWEFKISDEPPVGFLPFQSSTYVTYDSEKLKYRRWFKSIWTSDLKSLDTTTTFPKQDTVDNLGKNTEVAIPQEKFINAFGPSKNREEILRELYSTESSTIRSNHQPSFLSLKDSVTFTPFVQSQAIAYRKRFFIEDLSSQIDNKLLFEGLESFSQLQDQYQLPVPGVLLKGRVNEVLHNYQIEAAFRLPLNLVGSEAYLSIAFRKKRIDHIFTIYRKKSKQYVGDGFSNIRLATNTVMLQSLSTYAFDHHRSLRLQMNIRNDHNYFQATEQNLLDSSGLFATRFAVRGEYVFDNSYLRMINLREGWQAKFYIEGSKKMNISEDFSRISLGKSISFYTGFDLRYHFPILRQSIISLRSAAVSSVGQDRILFHLGGTENWIFPKFSEENTFTNGQNYTYQTLFTEIRGHPLGARKGGSAWSNSIECRIPIFKYLQGVNWKSGFIRSMQLIGFFDNGIAWDGLWPKWNEIQYVRVERENPVIQAEINYRRGAWISGAGAGIRTSLLGYFIRFDYAYQVTSNGFQNPLFHFSLGTDF